MLTGPPAIQLLKASGFSPIITTASKGNEEYCKSAGATHVIDYKEVPYPELPAAVKKITAEPIPVIYNAISTPDSQHAAWEILAPNGSVAVVLPPAVGKAGGVSEDGKKVAWAWGSAGTPRNYEFGKKMFPGVTKLLASGDLKVRLLVCRCSSNADPNCCSRTTMRSSLAASPVSQAVSHGS